MQLFKFAAHAWLQPLHVGPNSAQHSLGFFLRVVFVTHCMNSLLKASPIPTDNSPLAVKLFFMFLSSVGLHGFRRLACLFDRDLVELIILGFEKSFSFLTRYGNLNDVS